MKHRENDVLAWPAERAPVIRRLEDGTNEFTVEAL
jgi:hypothetical protein